jgi:hypothetical protein
VECSTKLRTISRLLCTLIYHLKTSNSVVAAGGKLSRTQSYSLLPWGRQCRRPIALLPPARRRQATPLIWPIPSTIVSWLSKGPNLSGEVWIRCKRLILKLSKVLLAIEVKGPYMHAN